MGRFKRSTSSNEAGDDASLAGWLYTDLLLGLAVVFLAGTAFVVPQLIDDEPVASADPVVSTSSTTTTTTIPVDYCTSLYAVEGATEKEQGIWVVVTKSSDSESVVEAFQLALEQELSDEALALIAQGKPLFELEDAKIGLMIAYGGYSGDQPSIGARDAQRAFTQINQSRLNYLFAETPEFPESIQRFFGTKSVRVNQVGFEIFPYIESPC
jgi:hypothetical protein